MAEKYKTVAEIIAERDRLRAECAALRADAERYRKLRDGQNWPAAFSRCDAPEPLRGVDLDAAIDGTEPHIDGWPLFSGLPQP